MVFFIRLTPTKKTCYVKHNNWLVVLTPQSRKEKTTGDHYPKYGGTKHILFRTTISLSLSMKVCAIEVCAHYTVSGPMLPRRTRFSCPNHLHPKILRRMCITLTLQSCSIGSDHGVSEGHLQYPGRHGELGPWGPFRFKCLFFYIPSGKLT
jgi:hypothetical protein